MLGQSGEEEAAEEGACIGALTSVGAEIPAAHEWAGLRSWPRLPSWPGSREAQAGELGGITGPQPLAGVAAGQLWAIFCGFCS